MRHCHGLPTSQDWPWARAFCSRRVIIQRRGHPAVPSHLASTAAARTLNGSFPYPWAAVYPTGQLSRRLDPIMVRNGQLCAAQHDANLGRSPAQRSRLGPTPSRHCKGCKAVRAAFHLGNKGGNSGQACRTCLARRLHPATFTCAWRKMIQRLTCLHGCSPRT